MAGARLEAGAFELRIQQGERVFGMRLQGTCKREQQNPESQELLCLWLADVGRDEHASVLGT